MVEGVSNGFQAKMELVGVGYRAAATGQLLELTLCLLYTSDAADERSSVDLGGRRIIKKKKTQKMSCGQMK